MQVTSWKNVGVDVQSAIGAAIPISAISKASPGVVSYTGTDPANGAYVLLTVVGMTQVNNLVARVSEVNTTLDTFELEGVNTTSFDTFVSGSFQVLTFGLSMSTVQNVSGSGGDPKYTDISTIHNDIDEEMPNGFSAVKFQMQNIWDPADTALIALGAASDSNTALCILFRFANGKKLPFNAYIAAALTPGGTEKVETPISFSVRGKMRALAT